MWGTSDSIVRLRFLASWKDFRTSRSLDPTHIESTKIVRMWCKVKFIFVDRSSQFKAFNFWNMVNSMRRIYVCFFKATKLRIQISRELLTRVSGGFKNISAYQCLHHQGCLNENHLISPRMTLQESDLFKKRTIKRLAMMFFYGSFTNR